MDILHRVAPDGANDTFVGFTLADAGFPGGRVDTKVIGCQNNTSYPNFFGTSAAAPHAAGAAALLWQANPAVSSAQLISALQKTAWSLAVVPGIPNEISGYGIIQVDAALTSLPPTPPKLSISSSSVTAGESGHVDLVLHQHDQLPGGGQLEWHEGGERD